MATRDRSVQATIRAHRWLLDAMLAQFPNGSVNVFDRDFRYLYAAGTGLARVGLSPAGLIGMRLDDLYSAEAVALVRPFYDRAFAGEAVMFTLPVFGREYSIRASPLTEPDGAITAIIAIAQEVPARPVVAEQLTPRQREIATLVAAGLTNNQIAERLMLAPRTARNYVGHLLKRLGFATRTQLGVWAIASGLCYPEGDDGQTGISGGLPEAFVLHPGRFASPEISGRRQDAAGPDRPAGGSRSGPAGCETSR